MPTALVIAGAQRSASTSLATHLAAHPSIDMAPREVLALDEPAYPAHVADVERHVRDAVARGHVAGIKRPELLHRPEGAERVARHLPGALVVISLREPVGRAVSAYRHYVRHGLLPDLPLDAGLRRLLERRSGRVTWEPGLQVLDYSLYADGVRRFLEQDRLTTLVIFQEEVVADSHAATQEILGRLGVDAALAGAMPTVNARPRVDRFGIERAANRIGYDIDVQRQSFAVTPNVARRGASKLLRMIAAAMPENVQRDEPLGYEVRRELVGLFEEDVAELERILERHVPPAWQTSLAR